MGISKIYILTQNVTNKKINKFFENIKKNYIRSKKRYFKVIFL